MGEMGSARRGRRLGGDRRRGQRQGRPGREALAVRGHDHVHPGPRPSQRNPWPTASRPRRHFTGAGDGECRRSILPTEGICQGKDRCLRVGVRGDGTHVGVIFWWALRLRGTGGPFSDIYQPALFRKGAREQCGLSRSRRRRRSRTDPAWPGRRDAVPLPRGAGGLPSPGATRDSPAAGRNGFRSGMHGLFTCLSRAICATPGRMPPPASSARPGPPT